MSKLRMIPKCKLRKLWERPNLCLQCASKYLSLHSYSSSASKDDSQPTFVIVKKSKLLNSDEKDKITSINLNQSNSDKSQVQKAIENPATIQKASQLHSSVNSSKTKLNSNDVSSVYPDISVTGSENIIHKPLPEAPTTCCQSGCPNCVWLDYAEQLSLHYKDGGQEAIKAINKDIDDPNLREYLLFEIRMKFK